MTPVAILGSGMVTGVGFDAPSTCAAIRVGITGFEETRFMYDGDWLIGCAVPFEEGWRGRERLLRMIVPAIQECLAVASHPLLHTPLLLVLAEPGRPGRFDGLDASFLRDIEERLGTRLHRDSALFAGGHVGGIDAVAHARQLVGSGATEVIVAGVDTLLVTGTLTPYVEKRWVQTAENSDGFIAGEAAGAVLLGRPRAGATLWCRGLGYGEEPAPIDSGEPLRAQGLVTAIKSALVDAGMEIAQVHYRISDIGGGQYWFKEAALALARTLRPVRAEFPLWHPADCIGEVGAAVVPCLLSVALAAARKDYAPGPGAICQVGDFGTRRGAMILHHQEVQ